MADTTIPTGFGALPGWADSLAAVHPWHRPTVFVTITPDMLGAVTHDASRRHGLLHEFYAELTVAGVPVGRTCGHRHETPDAAAKCHSKVIREATALLADETFHASAAADDVMVWTWGPERYDRRAGAYFPEHTDHLQPCEGRHQ